jgi:diguanylate cyclase (GGDEF)-like protein
MKEARRAGAEPPVERPTLEDIQASLQRLERRDWWLWAYAVLVMVLLTAGLATFSFPNLFQGRDFQYEFNLGLALRGLFGLVLVFSVYIIYQQIQIGRLRQQLSQQIGLLAQLEAQAEEFYELATLDPLTGLYNRRMAEQNLEQEISRSGRHDYPLTVLAVDLDSLKQINDEHGHAVGDLVLKAFAARLKKAIRSSDLPARMGGDEFLVILPECHPELVPRVLARLSGLEIEIGAKTIPVVFSAGWAGYQPGERPDQLLDRADQALYSNKRTGKVEEQVLQAKEEIRESQKMEAMGRLVGGVAHDFNNLLMTIKGYSELLRERLAAGDPLRRHVEEIHKASERADALTRQILAFGRRQALEPQVLNLNDLIGAMDTLLTRLAGEANELTIELDLSAGSVEVDPGQLEQIILHMVANARETIPQSGAITLRTGNAELDETFAARHPGAHAGSFVVVSVTNSGPVLSADKQAHMFEASRGGMKGANFLLATVYGVVKQNGGYIGVESEPGKGTTLSVYLPRVEPAVEAAEAAEEGAAGAEKETVLLVEDEAALLRLAREFLEECGYHVLEARDGEEALQVSDQYAGPIHLVLTDVVMPRMNGWELAKRLAIRRPETKVLYVSGHTDDATVRQGLLDPDINFLRKPFTLDTLQRTLREVLSNSRKAEPRSSQL